MVGTMAAKSGHKSDPESDTHGRALHVVKLAKTFGGPRAVDDISFTLNEGEFLTLLGPSGSGKSTTLMMIAGFEQPSAGDILVGDRSIVRVPPQHRNLGVVFQAYALFPHMSVVENVAFALRMRKMAPRKRRSLALSMLERMGLREFADRRPRQLSGGQQQRVALARALVFEPSVLLLDEPFGALDRRLREMLQLELMKIHREMGVSVVYVTHDQDEAMMMSDRIAVMRHGKIAQLGTPEQVYAHPETLFVARFLGDTNVIPCLDYSVAGAFAEVALANGCRGLARKPRLDPSDAALRPLICVRPERLRFLAAGESADTVVEGTVSAYTFLGAVHRYTIHDSLGRQLMSTSFAERSTRARVGQRVRVGWSRTDAELMFDVPEPESL